MPYATPDDMEKLKKLASEAVMNALIYGTSFIRFVPDGAAVRFELLDPWQTVKRLEEPCDETDAQALKGCEDLPFVDGDPYMRTPPHLPIEQLHKQWDDYESKPFVLNTDGTISKLPACEARLVTAHRSEQSADDFLISWNAHQAAEQAERAALRYAGKWPPPKA
jgi:hypothetical protein